MVSFEQDIDLKPYNTFGLHARARYFIALRSIEQLKAVLQSSVYQNNKYLILGGGSNILLTQDFDGLVLVNQLKGINILHEADDQITLSVASGEDWHSLVMHCVQNNWGGIENLALIPGTVGAAPMQNIGAYGVEVKDVIDQVQGIELASGNEMTFSNAACSFGYRESIFKHALKEKIFISSVTLTLTKKKHRLRMDYGAIQDTLKAMGVEAPAIQTIAQAVMSIRQSKLPDPRITGNSGSFFKNPTITVEHYELLLEQFPTMPGYRIENQFVKIPAGWMIESCGWKGKKLKHAGVHHQQALVIINDGEATGEEILALSRAIQDDVFKKFSIHLTPEVNII
jgi:UDP-N-acetylmuramate dehydrogenase